MSRLSTDLRNGCQMRLSERMRTALITSLCESFGVDSEIYLFGSRTDDYKRGGDIDIALRISLDRHDFLKKKARFLAAMLKRGYDLKIDLVQWNDLSDPLLAEELKKKAILLYPEEKRISTIT